MSWPVRSFAIGLLAAVLLLAPSGFLPLRSAPTKTARVTMIPSPSDVQVGDQLTITIAIEEADDVASVPFRVHFDGQVLEYETAAEATFLSRSGRQTAFLAALAPEGNEVIVGVTQLGPARGVEGRGEICTLRFRAKAPGDTKLAFDRGSVRNSLYQTIPATFEASPVIIP